MTRFKLITATATFAVATTPALAVAHGPASDHGQRHDRGVDHVRGTITSFTGGILTITKADGTTVSARVTSRTRIGCKIATPVGAAARHAADHRTTTSDQPSADTTDSSRSEDDSPEEATNEDHSTSFPDQSDDDGQGDDDAQGQGSSNQVKAAGRHRRGDQVRHRRCDTTDLTLNTTVRKGDLRGTGDAAVWRKLELSQ